MNSFDENSNLKKRSCEEGINSKAKISCKKDMINNKSLESKCNSINSLKSDGWNNLLSIIFILAIAKSILLYFSKFGFLVDIPISHINPKELSWSIIILFLRIIFSIFIFKNYNSCKKFKTFLTLIFLIIVETLNMGIIYYKMQYKYSSAVIYTLSLIIDMKLISYIIETFGKKEKDFKKFIEFLILPTLIYKDEYDRKNTRSCKKIIRKIILAFALFYIFVIVMDQYSVPALYNLLIPASLINFIDGFINLIISTIILFNLFFQIAFVCILESIAEFCYFSEPIYSEWWNSESTAEFWVKWNLPVHVWIKKYIYGPIKPYGRTLSQILSFFISGIFHELVLSLSIKSFSGIFFLTMILQVPFMYFSNYLKLWIYSIYNPRLASILSNVSFWMSFSVIGQPGIVLLFYRSLYLMELNE